MDHIESVKKFAALTRGEIGTGDRIYNADSFAFRLGCDNPVDAAFLVESLKIAEAQYSMLTGLPPTSLKRMAQNIRYGIEYANSI